MDDNKQDDAGTPPAGGSRERPPPTIELTASDVSESPQPDDAAKVAASDADRSEHVTPEDREVNNKPAPRKFSTRSRLLLVTLLASAATGAFAAGLRPRCCIHRRVAKTRRASQSSLNQSQQTTYLPGPTSLPSIRVSQK